MKSASCQSRSFDSRRIRLAIVSALAVNTSLTFKELKDFVRITDGNLTSTRANWKTPATSAAISHYLVGCRNGVPADACGPQALEKYLEHLEALIRATPGGVERIIVSRPWATAPPSYSGSENSRGHFVGRQRPLGSVSGASPWKATVLVYLLYGASPRGLIARHSQPYPLSFSSHNWERPSGEVTSLLGLLEDYLRTEAHECAAQGIRLRVIGRRDRIPASLVDAIERLSVSLRRAACSLRIALDYSSREAILRTSCWMMSSLGVSDREFARRLGQVTHGGNAARMWIPDSYRRRAASENSCCGMRLRGTALYTPMSPEFDAADLKPPSNISSVESVALVDCPKLPLASFNH